jgi:hypothetical protein
LPKITEREISALLKKQEGGAGCFKDLQFSRDVLFDFS